ncbi:MAG: shikimate dehydrogenase [Sulfuriferula sp.]
MTERYAVIGNPIAHSQSPLIHAVFARQTGQDLTYERLLAPLTGFAATLRQFQIEGGRGVNVTVPFKEVACQLADELTPRAHLAQAANTLIFTDTGILADNTDGAGLITDLRRNLNYPLARKRILLMGAGGAARGVIAALLAEQPLLLVIANRTISRAITLQQHFAPYGIVEACDYAALQGMSFDCVINATAASLSGASIALPDTLFAPGSLAYDMMYGDQATSFLHFAQLHGAAQCADGLGMLVEQAAIAFHLWRKVHPQTQPVIAQLRSVAHE